jgi:hypothetical protein
MHIKKEKKYRLVVCHLLRVYISQYACASIISADMLFFSIKRYEKTKREEEDEEERERERERERKTDTPCIVKCGARLYEMNVKISHNVPVLTYYRT